MCCLAEPGRTGKRRDHRAGMGRYRRSSGYGSPTDSGTADDGAVVVRYDRSGVGHAAQERGDHGADTGTGQGKDRPGIGDAAGKSRVVDVDAIPGAGIDGARIGDTAGEIRFRDIDAGAIGSDRAGNAVGDAAGECGSEKVDAGVGDRIDGAGVGNPAGERRNVGIDAGVVRIDRAAVDDAAVEARRIDLMP